MNMGSNLNELLPLAKKLDEANKILLEREKMLKQLSLLQNLTELLKSESPSKLFEISFRVVPTPSAAETLILSIRNVSETLSFKCQFWSWSVSFPQEGTSTTWNLPKSFKVNDCEQYSAVLSRHSSNLSSCCYEEEIVIRLNFAMKWRETSYATTFLIATIPLDILYVLSPARRSLSSSVFSTSSFSPFPTISSGSAVLRVCKFSIRMDERLRASFLELIVLKGLDVTRGFDFQAVIKAFETMGDFVTYVYDERLTISREQEKLVFKCPNPKVLMGLKKAVYKRLLALCQSGVVGIKCVQGRAESTAQSLYQRKLDLESITNLREDQKEEDFATLLGFYQELREEQENVMEFFIYDNNSNNS